MSFNLLWQVTDGIGLDDTTGSTALGSLGFQDSPTWLCLTETTRIRKYICVCFG